MGSIVIALTCTHCASKQRLRVEKPANKAS